MKKVIILFSLLLSINSAFSQGENFDTMLKKIAAEQDENTRIDLINHFFQAQLILTRYWICKMPKIFCCNHKKTKTK
jgi:hypothetical protein